MYYDEAIFKVGEQFPFMEANPCPGEEFFSLVTNTENVMLILYSPVAQADRRFWETGAMAVGLYSSPGIPIPFALLTFIDEPMAFTHALNMYDLNQEQRVPFLNLERETVNVLLVDAVSGILVSWRSIEVHWMQEFKYQAKKQLLTYPGRDAVQLTAESISAQMPVEDMFLKSVRLNLMTVQHPVLVPRQPLASLN